MAFSKKTPAINAASMADISFILLIFFLVVTTMGSEFGLIRMLPPMTEDTGEIQINERNVFVVLVSENNDLMVNKEYKSITELREMTKDFFNLRNDGPTYPVKIQKDLDLIGATTVNEAAVVSLQNMRGTSYKTYIQVQNELAAAIQELRDDFCTQRFGTKFDDCTKEQQDVVGQDVYPMSISEAEPRDART